MTASAQEVEKSGVPVLRKAHQRTAKVHLPLLAATPVFQLEPGIVVGVWTNIVVAAEPV